MQSRIKICQFLLASLYVNENIWSEMVGIFGGMNVMETKD